VIKTLTDDDLLADTLDAQDTAERSSWHVADNYLEFERRGWNHGRIASACDRDPRTVDKYIVCAKKYPAGPSQVTDNRPVFSVAFAEANGKKGAHVAYNRGEQQWYTPPEYIEAARAVLGKIDLDPASSDKAQETVRARRYFTAGDDGLSKPWRGRVWLNPPYSASLVGLFTRKLCDHLEAGEVTAALLLVNNCTERTWFQDGLGLAVAVCFPAGRVKFLDPNDKPGAPLQGQGILYFGPDAAKFKATFGRFGQVR
jgi:ParB family chromosome partitioning protein